MIAQKTPATQVEDPDISDFMAKVDRLNLKQLEQLMRLIKEQEAA